MRGGEGVDRQQAEGGLAVDDDQIVVVDDRAQDPRERLLPGDFVDEDDLGGRQVDVGGHEVEVLDACRHDDLVEIRLGSDELVVDRPLQGPGVDPQPGAGGPLRVEVDDEDAPPVRRQGGRQVDGRRRLADAALLVGHRDDAGGPVGVERGGNWEFVVGDRREQRILIGHASSLPKSRPSGDLPRILRAPCRGRRACRSAWSSPRNGRAAPGPPARRLPPGAGGWRRSGAACEG